MKEDKPGCQKAESVETIYIRYDLNNNFLTYEAIIPNHIEKEFKALESAICVTNKANQNLKYPT